MVFDEIIDERRVQDDKWGGPEHDDTHSWADWLDYIHEHTRKSRVAGNFRKQMIRVAALAVAAIESYDRIEAAEHVKQSTPQQTNSPAEDVTRSSPLVRDAQPGGAEESRPTKQQTEESNGSNGMAAIGSNTGGGLGDSMGSSSVTKIVEAQRSYYMQQLPGGICFAHGPYPDMQCPQWPKCATDPRKKEYRKLALAPRPVVDEEAPDSHGT